MNNSRPVGLLKPYALDDDGEYEQGFNRALALAEEIMQRKPGDPVLNPEWVKLEHKPHGELLLNEHSYDSLTTP